MARRRRPRDWGGRAGQGGELLLAGGSRLVAQHMGQGRFSETMLLLGAMPSGAAGQLSLPRPPSRPGKPKS